MKISKYITTYRDLSSKGPKAASYSPSGTGCSKKSTRMGLVIFTRLLRRISSSVRKLNATASTEFVAPCEGCVTTALLDRFQRARKVKESVELEIITSVVRTMVPPPSKQVRTPSRV